MAHNKAKGFLLGVLSWNTVFALPTDNQQVVHFQAGEADLDQQKHRGSFAQHVELSQGTTHLTASSAKTQSNEKNQLIKAILKGNQSEQAHYWTLTSEDKPPLHAYADTMIYYPQQHVIKLIGNARVEQGKNVMKAEYISYDTDRQHVMTKTMHSIPTTIVFYPDKQTNVE